MSTLEIKRLIDQVDDFMIAFKSGDQKKLAAEYAKFVKARNALKRQVYVAPTVAVKPVHVEPSLTPKNFWDHFDTWMLLKRSDF